MSADVDAIARRVAELAGEERLAEAALEVAALDHPGFDPLPYLDRLDGLASRVEGDTHLALRRVVAISEGIGGNVDDYYHPDNSFLDRVLDTRRGNPITLSLLWIEVGRRAGMEMQGVGLPGHFIVFAAGQLVDPFHYGEAIGFDEAARLVADALGGSPRLDRSWLEPVSGVRILIRLLRNLEQIFRERTDVEALEWVFACLGALARVAADPSVSP